MSEHKNQPKTDGFSVDEILAEYGSRSKVVRFPSERAETPEEILKEIPADERSEAEASGEDTSPVEPIGEWHSVVEEAGEKKELRPMDEIVPETAARHIGARLSALFRRADHYADHMYDDAEPDEETLRAEKYIPGVDREEPAREAPARKRPRRPEAAPPDTPAADLAARYLRGLTGRGRRCVLAFLLSVLTAAATPDLTRFGLVLPGDPFRTQCLILTGLLLAVGGLCWEVPWTGLKQLLSLRPNAQSIMLFAWLFTLADGLTAGMWEGRSGCLPCAAVTAFGMAFHLHGYQSHLRGDRVTAKAAAQTRSPYVITLDDNKWSGRPAYTKWSGSSVGFGSQLQSPDLAQRVYRVASPLLLLSALLCSVMASFGQHVPGRFLWAASAVFTAGSAWSALLAYGLPYKKLALRLNKVGAALAGWPGAERSRQGGIITTDRDLFPPGTVRVTQVKVFGGVSTEKAVGYTATLLRVLNCGLTKPFHDLLRTQGAFYREVSGVRNHEGGVSGIIRNQEVLVGTASFMHLMKVPMPQGLNVKNAVFCALNGQLAGMFLMEYRLSSEVNPTLSALIRANVTPILATRDFNLIPALLGQKFRLPVDKLEFPPIERRLELSQSEQEHDEVPVALLCREGLAVYSDAVVGARRLRSAARMSTFFAVLGAVVGVAITFYLTAVGAYTSLTPMVFLIFMALWLVPELLIANWVNQF